MFLGVFSAVLVGCFPYYVEKNNTKSEKASWSGRRSARAQKGRESEI